jgi:hypothetical protein
MKVIVFSMIAAAFGLLGYGEKADVAVTALMPATEYCDLYGAVFIEEVAGFANYRVHVEDVEAFADLLVFKEDAQAFANEPGHWYITDVKAFADFTIYVEEVKGFADFSIFYTDFRTTAGCR